MKKELLLIFFIVNILTMNAQTYTFAPTPFLENKVDVNQVQYFSASVAPGSYIQGVWSIEYKVTNGYFTNDYTGNHNMGTSIQQTGWGPFAAYVRWTTGGQEGKLIATIKNEFLNKSKSYTWTVSINSKPQTGIIRGAEGIYVNDTEDYFFDVPANYNNIEWIYDIYYFEKIDNGSSDSRRIKLKAKERSTNVTSLVKAKAKDGNRVAYEGELSVQVRAIQTASIKGKQKLSFNETAEYIIDIADNYKNVKWIYDTNYFEMVDDNSNDTRKIKIKAKGQMTDVTSNIKAEVYVGTALVYRGDVNIQIEKMKLELLYSGSGNYRIDEFATFTMEGLELLPNATIEWSQSNTDLFTYVSGQGSSKITYKVISVGKGEERLSVNAVVSFEGKKYAFETLVCVIEPYIEIDSKPNYEINPETVELGKELRGQVFNYGYNFDRMVWFNISSDCVIVHERPSDAIYQTKAVSDEVRIGVTLYYKNGFKLDIISSKFRIVPKSIQSKDFSSKYSVKIYTLKSTIPVYQKDNVENFNIYEANLRPGVYVLEKIDRNGNIKRNKMILTQ